MANDIDQLPFSVKLDQPSKRRPPVKKPNLDKRSREYLTPDEVKRMIAAAKNVGRHPLRDALLIRMSYRHAFRVSEVTDLKWQQINLDNGKIHVNRLKNGDDSVHYLEGDEIRALRALRRQYPESPFVFCSERKGPLSPNAVHKLVSRAGKLAGLEFLAHPHMLRHAKGYQLVERDVHLRVIQAYFGHKKIEHTVLYTKLGEKKFIGLGKD